MITWLIKVVVGLAVVAWHLCGFALLLVQTGVLLLAIGAKKIITRIASHRGKGGL